MKEWEGIRQLVQEGQFDAAKAKLLPLLNGLEEHLKTMEGRAFHFNHIIESYYYDYFIAKGTNFDYLDENIDTGYRLLGFLETELSHYTNAICSYKKALIWNPADLDSMLSLGELYKKKQRPEDCLQISRRAYPFCCTRATLARFYRNMGYYYLESSKPEVSAALYLYSRLYYPSRQADTELAYLEAALKKKLDEHSTQELQQILMQEQIPLGPNPDTVAITYRVGLEELSAGRMQNARDCLSMVYDVTGDEEAGKLLLT